MKQEIDPLAERLVKSKGFRWLPGMLIKDWSCSIRYLWAEGKWLHGVATEGNTWMRIDPAKSFPDLSDAPTLGAILQLVRETYGDNCACVFPIDYGPAGVMWQCRLTAGGRQLTQRHFSTEAEALVSALEAAQ